MSDPRDDVDFAGIADERATYIHDSSIVYDATKAGGAEQVGLAVHLSAAKTVSLVADAEKVEGKLIQVMDDGQCVVQFGGFMELPGGTSATLTVGGAIVGDLLVAAGGYIRLAAPATLAEVAVQRGSIIDASTTTAVMVRL